MHSPVGDHEKENLNNERRYRLEKAKYDEQISANEKEKERQRKQRLMELGARMVAGQGAVEALSSVRVDAPVTPSRPSQISQTIRLLGSRAINRTTLGVMTNCM